MRGRPNRETSREDRRPPAAEKHTVIVTSEDESELNVNLIRGRIQELSGKNEIQVKAVDKRRMYINTSNESNIEQIINKLNPIGNIKVHKRAAHQKRRVILKFVDPSVKKDDLLKEIEEKNPDKNIKSNKLTVIYEIVKPNWKDKNVVLAVEEDYYEEFLTLHRICTGHLTSKVCEYKRTVTQCYHCCRYGHRASINKVLVCTNEPACLLCAGTDHTSTNCKNEGFPKCINCVKAKNQEVQHPATSRSCRVYIKEENKLRRDHTDA